MASSSAFLALSLPFLLIFSLVVKHNNAAIKELFGATIATLAYSLLIFVSLFDSIYITIFIPLTFSLLFLSLGLLSMWNLENSYQSLVNSLVIYILFMAIGSPWA